MTESAIKALIDDAAAVRLDLAKALMKLPSDKDTIMLIARAGGSSSKLANALAAAEERAEKAEALQTGEKAAPNPEWEAKADAFHAATVAEFGVNPFDTLTMLRRWKADTEPANELGQISFSRAMLNSAADALSMALEISRAEYLRANAAESLVARFVEACGPIRAIWEACNVPPVDNQRRRDLAASLIHADEFSALASLTAEAKGE